MEVCGILDIRRKKRLTCRKIRKEKTLTFSRGTLGGTDDMERAHRK